MCVLTTRSPYPEEVNRRLITNLASYHFAATVHNRDTLLSEGVSPRSILVTGNAGVDSLKATLEQTEITSHTRDLLEATEPEGELGGEGRENRNPFGREDSGQCIAEVIAQELNASASVTESLLEQAS